MMPRMDGWALCAAMRASYDIPLLMLTAKGETSQKVKGFELGADDYMVKPFDPPELIVRVKALLKRYRIAASQLVEFGKVTMNHTDFQLFAEGEAISLPPKEFELLFKLASYPGKTFSRDQLIEQIWGMDYEGDERTVDVHIKRLRDRFPEEKYRFRISTIRGLGYRLEEWA
ncbi:Heme response regulator HssR [compost metagenome]